MLIEGSGDGKRQPDVVLDNGNIRLYCGDCLEILPTLEAGSVDAVVTSPPYFNARTYSHWDTYGDYLADMEARIAECARVLAAGRVLCINVSPVITPRPSRGERSIRHNIPAHVAAICERLGMWFCEDIIWIKPEGAAVNRNQRFSLDRHPMQWRANPVTENILIYQKPTDELNDAIIRRHSGAARVAGDYDRSNVWKMPPAKVSGHPAPFPVELPTKIAHYFTWSNDAILDPFMGSGTTGVACVKTRRKFIGIELDRGYFDIAVKRIEKALKERDESTMEKVA